MAKFSDSCRLVIQRKMSALGSKVDKLAVDGIRKYVWILGSE